MATNKKLRKDLLQLLNVSPQRLSQRVHKIKSDHGPMSTEDATYVIAHLERLDLTKYLSSVVVDRIRSLVPKANLASTSQRQKKTTSGIKRQVLIKMNSDLDLVDAYLSTTLANDAKEMAQIYPVYYALENSIRVVILKILESKYGHNWWDSQVPQPVRAKVADRKAKESTQPWHGKRGQHEIYYSDFSHLKSIITKNWSDFQHLFPSVTWITQRLEELEHPRNVLAHHNPIGSEDRKRIDLYFHDWIALLNDRRRLLPL